MIRELLQAVAYSKAPRTTFVVLHPASAAQLGKLRWDMRHAQAPRITALGVAALALPLGMWLGRKRAERSNGAARGNGQIVAEVTEFEAFIDDVSGPMRAGERTGFGDQTAPRV